MIRWIIKKLKDDMGFRGAFIFLLCASVVWDTIIMLIDQRKGLHPGWVPYTTVYFWPMLLLLLIIGYLVQRRQKKRLDKIMKRNDGI